MTFAQMNKLRMLICHPQLFHWSCVMAKHLIGWDGKGWHPQYCVRDCNNNVLFLDQKEIAMAIKHCVDQRRVLTMFYYVKYFYFSSAAQQQTKNSQCLAVCRMWGRSSNMWLVSRLITEMCPVQYKSSSVDIDCGMLSNTIGSNFGGLWEKAFHFLKVKMGAYTVKVPL